MNLKFKPGNRIFYTAFLRSKNKAIIKSSIISSTRVTFNSQRINRKVINQVIEIKIFTKNGMSFEYNPLSINKIFRTREELLQSPLYKNNII